LVDVPLSVKAVFSTQFPVNPARGLTAIYSLVLIVLAIIPRVEGPGIGISDSVLHAVAYGVFGGLVLISLRPVLCGLLGGITALVSAVGMGLATEFLQLLVPYRSFEIRDVIADGVGALVVIGMLVVGMSFRDPGRGQE